MDLSDELAPVILRSPNCMLL